MKRESRADMRPIRQKTLEELVGPTWADPDYPSAMVQRVRALGSVPVGQFSAEDLRLVIGQQRGLRYLVPVALDLLEEDPLRSGNLYPGDLLLALTRVPDPLLAEQEDWRTRIRRIVQVALSRLETIPDYDPWDTDLSQLEAPNSYDRDSLVPKLRELQQRLT